ncbi:MauE/DoxX family redox-associated membrane protein [Chamaesiphon sp.]|uniref:MauE/DoxX family redox-associated membrane protein n=1 Tax=Chamaesiphon sp. TaxID=2814140 RepID=UPI0035937620
MKTIYNLNTAVAVNRITLGVFFFISGISNYINFNVKDGFYQTVLTQKLQLWGPFPAGWQGIGPLPGIIAVPYAWLLPLAEILLGALFAMNFWIEWTGLLLILLTFSIILAFGVIPAGTLFPNAAESFNKNIFFMTLTWICIAYDRYAKKMSQRRARSAEYELGNADDEL